MVAHFYYWFNSLEPIEFGPGPGKYQIPSSIAEKGNLFLSKFETKGVIKFNPISSERFRDGIFELYN